MTEIFRDNVVDLSAKRKEKKGRQLGSDPHNRAAVVVDDPLNVVIDDCMHILARDAHVDGEHIIYQRSSRLVDVVGARIREIPTARLYELVDSYVSFWHHSSTTEEGKKLYSQQKPPREVIDGIIARGQWQPIKHLNGITNWPVLRCDGTILSERGYDEALELICMPDVAIDLTKEVSKDDALAAVEVFHELTSEFPFVDDAHFASWMAMMLTPFARHSIDGRVPLGILEASERGTGKTYAADLIGYIVSGRELPRSPVSNSEEEWRKNMLGIGMSGQYAVLFDNVVGTLKSPALDMAITGGHFEDRKLGTQERLSVKMNTQFLTTVNNATISPDLVRRSILCRQDAAQERPEQRSFSKNPKAEIRSNRAKYVSAALTILRAYILAGKPKVEMRAMAGFEEWSGIVRAPLVWLGLPDPTTTQDSLKIYADAERGDTLDLFEAWTAAYGNTEKRAKDVIGDLANPRNVAVEGPYQDLREAIVSICGMKDGKLPSARSLGRALGKLRGQIRGNRRLIATSDLAKRGDCYRVEQVVPD